MAGGVGGNSTGRRRLGRQGVPRHEGIFRRHAHQGLTRFTVIRGLYIHKFEFGSISREQFTGYRTIFHAAGSGQRRFGFALHTAAGERLPL